METQPRSERLAGALPIFSPVPDLDQVAYDRMAESVRKLLGIDLTQYKPAQVWRRVNGFSTARGFANADALLVKVSQDAALRQTFLDMLTINVSEFFRNPEAWDALVAQHLKPMLTSQLSVRIWSAGCSLGFEPFTIAMLARELAPHTPIYILATDLDDTTLSRAKKGQYTESQMAGVSPARRAKFFRQLDNKSWEARPELQAPITWRRHDLLKDPHEHPFDIICCRNVVIYFTETAKTELYKRFTEALRPGGLLFLGATESIPNVRAIGLLPSGLTFYKRP
ncbi:MAG TPA: protein-glutamate O-methyltransferase CheR [Candidatus Limnocylindrales bacterium]